MAYKLTMGFNSCMWLLVLISGVLQPINAQAQCDLPRGQRGYCVNVDRCPLIMGILRDAPKPLPPNVSTYISGLYCGQVNNRNGLCCQRPTGIEPPTIPTSEPPEDIPTTPQDVTNHVNLRFLSNDECGPLNTPKLAGGNRTELYEFPWMALLRYNTPDGLRNACGGSIISDRYILTAAHCITRLRSDFSLHSAILGEYDTTTDRDCVTENNVEQCLPPIQEIPAEASIPHQSYNRPPYANDIGLVRLARRITFDDHIQPVCLPVTPSLQHERLDRLIVTGWGTTEFMAPSAVLLKASLGVTPLQDCQRIHRRVMLSENQICAKGEGIVDSCKGDSGGPLGFPYDFNGAKFIQFGIVSAGVPSCGEGDAKPGIYVKVANYMKWILDNMRN